MDPPGAEGIDREGRDLVSGSSANFAPPVKAPASRDPRASGPRAPILPSEIRGDPPDRVSDPWDQKRMTPGRASTEAGTPRSTKFATLQSSRTLPNRSLLRSVGEGCPGPRRAPWA